MSEFTPQEQDQDGINTRRAFRVAIVYTIVAFASLGLAIFLIPRFPIWQVILMAVIAVISFGLDLAALVLLRRNQPARALKILYWSSICTVPINALLFVNVTSMLAVMVLAVGFINVYYLFPASWPRRKYMLGPVIAVVMMLIVELINPPFRVNLGNTSGSFGPIVVVFIIFSIIVLIINRALRGNLRAKLTISFVLVAVIPLLVVGVIASIQTYNAQLPQALELQSQVAQRVAERSDDFIRARENELRALTDIRGLARLSLDEQEELLASLLSTQGLYDELILLDGNGQEQIYLSRVEVSTPDNLTSRAGAIEFEQPKESGETYFSPVQFDRFTGEPFMVIAIPVIDLRTGEMAYALIANFRFKTVWDLMAQEDVVGRGTAYMVDDNNQVVAHANPSVVLQGTQVDLPVSDSFATGIDGTEVAIALERINLGGQTFTVVAELPQSEATALATNNLIITIAVVVVAVVIASIFGTLVARNISTPIVQLAGAAETVSAGNFSQQVEIDSQDEIGTLATAFNSMMTQLSDLIGSLEQQVTDRTRALEISTEVSRRLSTILDQDQLVREVVEQLRSAFDYYHAQIYFYDDEKRYLVMAGGTGDAGRTMLARGHKIETGQGLVGQAAKTNQAVLISDVSQATGWLSNPLLPETRAEVAIPIAVGENVLGVLDVQHNIPNGLSEEDVDLIQAIANQVAIAIQNAQAYTESQHRAVREAQVSAINQRIQSANTIEDVLKIAVRELGQALSAERTNVELSVADKPNEGPTVN